MLPVEMEYVWDLLPGMSRADAERANVVLLWSAVQQSRREVTAEWEGLAQGHSQMRRTRRSIILFAELMRWRSADTGLSIEVAFGILQFLVPSAVVVELPPPLRFGNGPTMLHRRYLQGRIRREGHELLELHYDLTLAQHPHAANHARLQRLAQVVATRGGQPPDALLAFAAVPVVVNLLREAAMPDAEPSEEEAEDAWAEGPEE